MSGDEALGRVAMDARAAIRLLFDEKGELLSPHDWPDSVAGCVKAIQHGPYGLKITLVDPLVALRIILEQTGKLKSTGDGRGNVSPAQSHHRPALVRGTAAACADRVALPSGCVFRRT